MEITIYNKKKNNSTKIMIYDYGGFVLSKCVSVCWGSQIPKKYGKKSTSELKSEMWLTFSFQELKVLPEETKVLHKIPYMTI